MAYELLMSPQLMAYRHRPPTSNDDSLSFGARMRHERERRQISIATIAESTKILGALLEGLENDDVSRWPTGFYRRAFMRAYAHAIGVDAEAALKEFLEHFPEPVEAAAAQSPLPSAAGQSPTMPVAALRVQAPAAGAWFTDGALVTGLGMRCFAVAVDLFVVSVMGLALFVVLGMFWAPAFLATAAYYSVSILVLGNTPGVCLFADPSTWNSRVQRLTVKGFTGSLVHRFMVRPNS
jgi:transcriptional regulator with XRE-family HTH domain